MRIHSQLTGNIPENQAGDGKSHLERDEYRIRGFYVVSMVVRVHVSPSGNLNPGLGECYIGRNSEGGSWADAGSGQEECLSSNHAPIHLGSEDPVSHSPPGTTC